MTGSACCGSVALSRISGLLPKRAAGADAVPRSSRCRVAWGANSQSFSINIALGGWTRFKNVHGRRAATAKRAGVARAEVKYVNVEEAKEMVEKGGYTILDIRDKTQHERSHIPTSEHIPYFIENTDNDIGTIINRQMHNNFAGLLYGLAYTKPNPEFVQQVTAKFHDKEQSKLLLVCQEGLRSGYAAEKLEAAGFTNVAYINAGLNKVPPGVFPKEGKKELQDAGKAGLVTIQGPVSRVVGIILVLAYLFLQFFPDQANELFFKS